MYHLAVIERFITFLKLFDPLVLDRLNGEAVIKWYSACVYNILQNHIVKSCKETILRC